MALALDDVRLRSGSDAATMLERARALLPRLRERAAATAASRRLPQATFADLYDAGILSILRPQRFGGLQLPWGTHAEVAAVLAEACGSTSWICSVVGAHVWVIGRMGLELQQEVFDRRDVLISTAFAQGTNARVMPVDGGYRLSGRWALASGVEDAQWVALAAPARRNDWGSYEMTLFAIPTRDVTIIETWNSDGLPATGSHDVAVDDLFVPQHRTGSFNATSEYAQREGPYLYRLEIFPYYYTTLLGPLIGTAVATWDAYLGVTRERYGQMHGDEIRRQIPVHLRVAESGAEINAAILLKDEVFRLCREAEAAERTLTREEKLRIRAHMGLAARLCKGAADRLLDMMGAAGLTRGNPVVQPARDLRAAASHGAIAWDPAMAPFGAHALGLPTGQQGVDQTPGDGSALVRNQAPNSAR
jgi:3-hydroxy-9,10-secoandrosta-1,3,5(10)-triene-9,17-dione monooxygenase